MMLRALFFFFVLVFASAAQASFPATNTASGCTSAPCYQYDPVLITDYGSTLGAWYSTPAAAAAAAVAAANASTQWWRYSVVSAGSSSYVFSTVQVTTGNNIGNDSRAMNSREVPPVSPTYSCPANSTLTGSLCTCDKGFNESGSSCIAPVVNNQQNCSDAAAAGSSSFGQQRINVKLTSGTSMCISNDGNSAGVGCRVDLLDVGVIKLPDGTRIVQGFPRRTNTGADTCPIASDSTAPTTPQAVEEAPKACPNGQIGTVNGETRCIAYPAGTTTTTKAPSSTSTSTTTGVDGNSPTSSSASGETTCVTGTGKCTTTTTTTTTNANGTVTTTTNTTEEEDGSASDVAFGGVPTLYESKYPDGVTGVWNEQMTAIKGSQVGKLMSSLTPTFQTGGSCPTWTVDLSIWGSYGTWNVAPACWVWPIAKVFTIIGALWLARALIFGG